MSEAAIWFFGGMLGGACWSLLMLCAARLGRYVADREDGRR
jgi:hypothetical protein